MGTRLIGTPCWCLISMLAFILYKNMHLSPLQITIIVALKPASSLLVPYWSQAIYQRSDRIIKNLIGANFLRHLPLFFIPWFHSSWFIIFSFGIYMLLTRATIPAWMELFKYTLPKTRHEEIIGYGTIIDYLGTATFTVVIGMLLDNDQGIWKWLFSISAGLGILSSFLFILLPELSAPTPHTETLPSQRFKIQEKIFRPWRQIWQLISCRKDFLVFQIGFMFGGAGLMIMQPVLPQFFVDTLHLSFTEIGIALALCKGVGVALTSPLWTRLFRKVNIFRLSALVTFFAALFPFFLLASSSHLALLYFAYVFYGIMQAGSELSWHMSGLVFAQEKDSSLFSSINVLTVGIRGCMVPAIGSMLVPFIHPVGVILLGALLCLLASGYFLFNGRTHLALE
ncbi:MAG: MFS transporter [Chlamydiales bacterium]|nr:MFS transporter [Chlamydiales bacterium]